MTTDEDWRGWKFDLSCPCDRCQPIKDYIEQQVLIRTFSPNKGKNMNEFETQDHLAVVDATEVALVPVDAEGNPIAVEPETEVVGHVQSGEGEVAVAADLI